MTRRSGEWNENDKNKGKWNKRDLTPIYDNNVYGTENYD